MSQADDDHSTPFKKGAKLLQREIDMADFDEPDEPDKGGRPHLDALERELLNLIGPARIPGRKRKNVLSARAMIRTIISGEVKKYSAFRLPPGYEITMGTVDQYERFREKWLAAGRLLTEGAVQQAHQKAIKADKKHRDAVDRYIRSGASKLRRLEVKRA